MRIDECPRESDVLAAVAAGRWPERCGELRDHVERCPVCADVVLVAQALRESHDEAWERARVPSAGHVWWRAEVRARQEAAAAAGRPITVLQALGAAAALVAALVLAGLQLPALRAEYAGLLSAALPWFSSSEGLAAVVKVAAQPLLLALVLGLWLLLAPVLVYLLLASAE